MRLLHLPPPPHLSPFGRHGGRGGAVGAAAVSRDGVRGAMLPPALQPPFPPPPHAFSTLKRRPCELHLCRLVRVKSALGTTHIATTERNGVCPLLIIQQPT